MVSNGPGGTRLHEFVLLEYNDAYTVEPLYNYKDTSELRSSPLVHYAWAQLHIIVYMQNNP